MAVRLGYKKVYRDPLGYPEWQAQGLPVASSPPGAGQSSAPPERPLHGWALLGTLAAVFAAGLALNLTPCVYPLIPITVSYFAGRAGQGGTLAHGLAYLLGLAFTNSLLGSLAALTGGILGAALQSPWVILALAGVMTALGLSMLGVWEIRLPARLTSAAGKSRAGLLGSLFMGLTLGVVAAPCLGPFVLGLLTWVASLGSPWLGFLIFFTLSLGLGLPLFVLALLSGRIQALPRSGQWMVWVKKLMGWVLFLMAAHFLGPLLPAGGRWPLLAAIALAAGVHLGWLEKSEPQGRALAWLKLLAGLSGVVAATWLLGSWLLMGPGVDWRPMNQEALERARAEAKPVIVDFYADWCAPCRELEEITFHDRPVVELAAKEFVMLKLDLTGAGDGQRERLLKQWEIKGVPTVVFLGRDGKELLDLRLVDYLPPERFRARMQEALGR